MTLILEGKKTHLIGPQNPKIDDMCIILFEKVGSVLSKIVVVHSLNAAQCDINISWPFTAYDWDWDGAQLR
jgi:hypothetical protein